MKDGRVRQFIDRVSEMVKSVWAFISDDIWRITDNEVSGIRHILINMAKTVIISVRRFIEDDLQRQASALTYSTLLAIVPVLAMLFAIAKGFGFQTIIQSQLFDYFPAQKEALMHALTFVDAYLNQSKGGVLVGIGLIFLLWTIVGLIGNVESTFNEIWQVKKSRTLYRKITDYISLFLILPVLMIASSGISIFVSTNLDNSPYLNYISPLFRTLIAFAPYVLTWLFFTGMYMLIPNTKVKLKNAFPAGVISGTAFQLFQFLYISGQIWVSKYNAVYGSFAFLPLLLLWMQLSWLICLFGAMLTFSAQNIANYNFEEDTKNISRRYKDFLTLLVASIVVERFEKGEPPLTVDQISSNCRIPIKLTGQIIFLLTETGILSETTTDDERVSAYQPAVDIQKISVGFLFRKLEEYGSENFRIDNKNLYGTQWKALMSAYEAFYKESDKVLLKNLPVPENKI